MSKITVQDPQRLILFGATGDLAQIKLFPALFELFQEARLPADFGIIGFGRTPLDTEQFQQKVANSILKVFPEAQNLPQFLQLFSYFAGQYDQVADFQRLQDFMKERGYQEEMIVSAYFSVPPTVFEHLANNLAQAWPQHLHAKIRLIIEKPFGLNHSDAEHLHGVLSSHFPSENLFLLDHFLGKKPIQSILKLRLENSIINLLLRGPEIASIQIIADETAEVGQRIGYYDQVGAAKDMLQSHLLQILALITMDIPLSPTVESIQREKQNILSALRFSGAAQDLFLGQYQGYLDSPQVQANSEIETYIAIKLFLDRRDWYNVPIYLRTGKKMAQNQTKVIITFKKMPFQSVDVPANTLIFEAKPGESLSVSLSLPNDEQYNFQTPLFEPVMLQQSITCNTSGCLGDYASLLLDIMSNRKIYFVSYPEILSAWKLLDYLSEVKQKLGLKPQIYANGGPIDHETINFSHDQKIQQST